MKPFQPTVFALLLLFLVTMMSMPYCKKPSGTKISPDSTDTPYVLTPDTIVAPSYFPKPVIPNDNKPYKERIQLGRMLYYDSLLSGDGSRACASCHRQEYGFSDTGLYAASMPVLPHVNLAWYSNFMWDGSQTGTLEDVMLFEVQVFFATDLNKMNQNTVYRSLFKKYFNVSTISYKEIAYALAQYLRSVVSGNTKFEQVMFHANGSFTTDEYWGYRIFFTETGDCFHCHVNPVMTDGLFHNTGLDSLYAKDADKGLYNVSGKNEDLGKFRTANLRNVALRTRFMHDGRFTTLEDVIDFYDHGMHKVSNLDPVMALPTKAHGLHLNATQKRQLIAFLNTLTDSTFIKNPAYAKP